MAVARQVCFAEVNILSVEIGGTKLQLAGGNEHGSIIKRHRFEVKAAAGAEGIRNQIETAISTCFGGNIDAVGVGFGGPVDWKTGTIRRSHQVEGWSGFDLRTWLQGLTGAVVAVDNDANVAALGEAKQGAGQGLEPVFYVTLGSGVGGGLVVNGQIYHGAIPGESEIGHVRLERSGTPLEARCSGWAIDARVRELVQSAPRSVLARLAAGSSHGEARFLPAALSERDTAALHILHELCEDLAFGLSHVVHLMHPEVIVIGGGLSLIGEPLRNGVECALDGFLMEAFFPGPKIVLSVLREDAVPVGALNLAAMLKRP